MDPNITIRKKSPTRAEAISLALKPGPTYSNGVLLGNWVEDRTECPKGGSLYYPPKETIDYKKLRSESRQPEFRNNKLNSLQGNVTEWGLKEYLKHSWACDNISDYLSTLYEDTFVPPSPTQYLQPHERKGRDGSFTKTFRFKMTKSKR